MTWLTIALSFIAILLALAGDIPLLFLIGCIGLGFVFRQRAGRIVYWLTVACFVATIGWQWHKFPDLEFAEARAYYGANMTYRIFLNEDDGAFIEGTTDAYGRKKRWLWTYAQIREPQPNLSERYQAHLPPVPDFRQSFDNLALSTFVGVIWGTAIWIVGYAFSTASHPYVGRLRFSGWSYYLSPPESKANAVSKDWRFRSVLYRVFARIVKYTILATVGLMLAFHLNAVVFDFGGFIDDPMNRIRWIGLSVILGVLALVPLAVAILVVPLYWHEWRKTWEACFEGLGVVCPWQLNSKTGGWFRRNSPYRLAGVRLPEGREHRHVFISGAAETGRIDAIADILDQIHGRGDIAIVDDRDGFYHSQFHREGRDTILDPHDVRCAGWDIFADADKDDDFGRIGEILIPEFRNVDDPQYVEAARGLFADVATAMRNQGDHDTAKLLQHLLRTDAAELVKLLGDAGVKPSIDLDDRAMVSAMRAALDVHAKNMPLLGAAETPGGSTPGPAGASFSFRKWFAEADRGGFVFLSGRSDTDGNKEIAGSVMAGVERIAMDILCSLKEKPERRAWLVVDDAYSDETLRVVEGHEKIGRSGGCIVLCMGNEGKAWRKKNAPEFDKAVEEFGTHLFLPPDEQGKPEWMLNFLRQASHRSKLGLEDIEHLPPVDGFLGSTEFGRFCPIQITANTR